MKNLSKELAVVQETRDMRTGTVRMGQLEPGTIPCLKPGCFPVLDGSPKDVAYVVAPREVVPGLQGSEASELRDTRRQQAPGWK